MYINLRIYKYKIVRRNLLWVLNSGQIGIQISVFKMREGATYEAGGNYRRAFQSSGVARVADREKNTRQNFYGKKLPGNFFRITICFRENFPPAAR